MAQYSFSQRTRGNFVGVDPRLVKVAYRALEVTDVDFGVIEGVRTKERQAYLVKIGASQTMQSKHIDGLAIDTMAYINGKGTFQPNLYDNIADAFATACRELGVDVRWGGAWQINDIRTWNGTMQEASDAYVALRRREGKKPFLDQGHFELIV